MVELVEELRGRNAAVPVGFADHCTYGARSYLIDLDAGQRLQQVAQRHRAVGFVPEIGGQVGADRRVDVDETLVLGDAGDQHGDALRLTPVVRRHPLETAVARTLTDQANRAGRPSW